VFAGGWTLEAAETVGAACGVPDLFDGLAILVEQSLVVRDAAAPKPRYRLLETIREFAGEELRAAGEATRARTAHFFWLLQLARHNDLERLDAGIDLRLDCLKAEETNIGAGLEWAIDHQPEAALAMLAELDWFWFLADRHGRGRELHERVLAADIGSDLSARLRVLQQATWLASAAGDFAALEAMVQEVGHLAEQLGDARAAAYVRMHQGDIAMSQGDRGAGTRLMEDALARFIAFGDDWGTVVCLTNLGIACQDRGDLAAALSHFERVGAFVTERRLPADYEAHVLVNLASVLRLLGRPDEAIDASTAALRLTEDGGRKSTAAVAHHDLGRLALDRGDLGLAASHAAKSLAITREIGSMWDVTPTLELAAAVLLASGENEAAARLFAAAAGLREAMPYPIGAGERPILERWLDEVHVALGEPKFARAWRVGQARPLDTIVDESLALLAAMIP
jgi:tetratricopeptide (TPR) repeat protein